MLVEIGHEGNGRGAAVTYARLPDEVYPSIGEVPVSDQLSIEQLALHLQRQGLVTHIPGYESFLAIAHPWGIARAHEIDRPLWVRSSDPALESVLSKWLDVPSEAPSDVEDTHWTRHGGMTYPPGAQPDPAAGVTALLNDGGFDLTATALFSAGTAATLVGDIGTATATTSTSLTGGGGATHVGNDSVGMMIVALASGAYGIITANTSGATPVFTVDRWYAPATPGGSAASTPGATTGYMIIPGGPAMLFMALSTSGATPTVSDNYPGGSWAAGSLMSSEYNVVGGGLQRKIATMAHTAGANTLTATAVFTVNGTDSGLPLTFAKMGMGPSFVPATRCGLQTLLSTTATVNTIGDQLTVTDTVTI